MTLIRIKHKNLPDGVLIAERDFNPAKHEKFVEPKGAAKPPATAPANKPPAAPPAPKKLELAGMNAKDAIALVATVEEIGQLEDALATEIRSTVKEALVDRIAALSNSSGE
jgi:hypothetical protein